MKKRVFKAVLVCATIVLVASVVTAQDASDPAKSAPWAPTAQPGAPQINVGVGVPGVPGAPPQISVALPGPPGQPAPTAGSGESSKLEDIIAEVIKSSPDVQVAEAQLREAEAKLRQAQMQAVQKATEAYAQRMRAEEVAGRSKMILDQMEQKKQVGAATNEELLKAQQELAEAQTEIARYGAELQALLGTGLKSLRGAFGFSKLPDQGPLVQEARPTLDSIKNEDLKAKLNGVTSIDLDDCDLPALTAYLSASGELNIATDPELTRGSTAITLRLQSVPLKDILLAASDSLDNACFVIREYGLLVTTREKAQHIAAPCIPDTVPLYVPAKGPAKTTAPIAAPKPQPDTPILPDPIPKS